MHALHGELLRLLRSARHPPLQSSPGCEARACSKWWATRIPHDQGSDSLATTAGQLLPRRCTGVFTKQSHFPDHVWKHDKVWKVLRKQGLHLHVRGPQMADRCTGVCAKQSHFADDVWGRQGLQAWSPGRPPEGGTSAPASVRGQRGGSPLQAYALRPVTDCNCVAARRGGEQQEVNDQSVG